VLGTALAGPLVDCTGGTSPARLGRRPPPRPPASTTSCLIFAYYFIPQIFFYGMDSLLGAILNTKGRFGANMWTPVINNVVVIAVGGLFILTEGVHRTR